MQKQKVLILSVVIIVIVFGISIFAYILINNKKGGDGNEGNIFESVKLERFQKLEPEQDYESFKAMYQNEDVLEDYSDFVISQFYDEEKQMRGGGCLFDISEYRIVYSNNVYKIDLNSLYQLTSPDSESDFISLVRKYDEYNIKGCSKHSLLDIKEYNVVDPENNECDFEEMNVEPDYQAGKEFTYYFVDEEYPLTISKVTLNFEGEEDLTVSKDEVGRCELGGYQF